MGIPMIKAKKSRNYRRGRIGRWCLTCDHFVYNAKGPNDHRCRVIGDGGRGYRVLFNHLCDDYDDTQTVKRRGKQ